MRPPEICLWRALNAKQRQEQGALVSHFAFIVMTNRRYFLPVQKLGRNDLVRQRTIRILGGVGDYNEYARTQTYMIPSTNL